MWPPHDVIPIKGSIGYKYWRSCRTKVRFASERFALEAQSRMRDGSALVAYECPDCFGWHLGHGVKRAL